MVLQICILRPAICNERLHLFERGRQTGQHQAQAAQESARVGRGKPPTRGTLFLQRAARAHALVSGRDYCIPDDIKGLAVHVLSHRVILNARGGFGRRQGDAEDVIRDILESVEVPV